MFPLRDKRIFVAGHRGMVGSAVVRRLQSEGCETLTASRAELDLCSQAAVRQWMAECKPNVVVLAAAKVGGILANDNYRVDFLLENLLIQSNVIEAAVRNKVRKFLFLGSSCIYPKFASQPITEDALLTGLLEPTNEPYAIAKIAGLKLCQAYRRQHGVDFITAMLSNLYGPGDNFDFEKSHVIPGIMRKAHEAKRDGVNALTVWGTGTPKREFLHVDDAADAIIFLLKNYSGYNFVNVGSGEEITILDVAQLVASVVGFEGEIVTDASKPDGTPRKLMDTSKLFGMGWRPRYDLKSGLAQTYAWFKDRVETGEARLGA